MGGRGINYSVAAAPAHVLLEENLQRQNITHIKPMKLWLCTEQRGFLRRLKTVKIVSVRNRG